MKKTTLALLVAIWMVTITATAQINPKIYVGINDPSHDKYAFTVCNPTESDSVPFFDHTIDNEEYTVTSRAWIFEGSIGDSVLVYSGYRPVVYGRWDKPGEYKVRYSFNCLWKNGTYFGVSGELSILVAISEVKLERKKMTLTRYQFLDQDGNLFSRDSAIAVAKNSEPAYYLWTQLSTGMLNSDYNYGRLNVEVPGLYTVKCVSFRGAVFDGNFWIGCSSVDTFEVFPNVKPLGLVEYSPNEIHLYPNPTETNLSLPDIMFFNVYDIYGRKVTSGESDKIDVSNFPKGFYYIRTAKNGFGKFQKI